MPGVIIGFGNVTERTFHSVSSGANESYMILTSGLLAALKPPMAIRVVLKVLRPQLNSG